MSDRPQALAANRFVRFVVAGGIAASVNVMARHLLSEKMSFRWAVIIAYLFGMTTAWILARLFVFEASNRRRVSEFLRFGLINFFAAAQVWLVSVCLAEWLFPRLGYHFHPEDTAHIVGVSLPVFTSYLGHKHFSFAKDKSQPCG